MNQFRQRGSTVLMVSHDLTTVRGFCQRVLWIDHGTLRRDGPAGAVIDEYLASVHARPV